VACRRPQRAGEDAVTNLAIRVMTAAVLVPLVVWGVLALPTGAFGLGLALFVVAGAWEWADLAGYPVAGRAAYAAGVAAILAGAQALIPDPAFTLAVLGLAMLWWLVALLWVLRYQTGRSFPGLDNMAVRAALGILVLVPAWTAMTLLHGAGGRGPAWVMLILVIVWGADTGAYFAGRRFGRHRLASRVSPGKTVEGVAGGLLAAGAISGSFAWWWLDAVDAVAPVIALGIATALAAVLGDLAESLIKRCAGRKDSGVLIPGHGGVLDRIDSLTAAAPVFVAGLAIQDMVS